MKSSDHPFGGFKMTSRLGSPDLPDATGARDRDDGGELDEKLGEHGWDSRFQGDGMGTSRNDERGARARRARSPGLDGAARSSDDACGEREDALHGDLLLGVQVPRTGTTLMWYLSGSHARFLDEVVRVSRRKVRARAERARTPRSRQPACAAPRAVRVVPHENDEGRPEAAFAFDHVRRTRRGWLSQSAGCSSTRSGSTNGNSPSVPSISGSPSPSTVICAATSASRRSWNSALPSPGEICSWR
jgi:hypothetical protein